MHEPKALTVQVERFGISSVQLVQFDFPELSQPQQQLHENSGDFHMESAGNQCWSDQTWVWTVHNILERYISHFFEEYRELRVAYT